MARFRRQDDEGGDERQDNETQEEYDDHDACDARRRRQSSPAWAVEERSAQRTCEIARAMGGGGECQETMRRMQRWEVERWEGQHDVTKTDRHQKLPDRHHNCTVDGRMPSPPTPPVVPSLALTPSPPPCIRVHDGWRLGRGRVGKGHDQIGHDDSRSHLQCRAPVVTSRISQDKDPHRRLNALCESLCPGGRVNVQYLLGWVPRRVTRCIGQGPVPGACSSTYPRIASYDADGSRWPRGNRRSGNAPPLQRTRVWPTRLQREPTPSRCPLGTRRRHADDGGGHGSGSNGCSDGKGRVATDESPHAHTFPNVAVPLTSSPYLFAPSFVIERSLGHRRVSMHGGYGICFGGIGGAGAAPPRQQRDEVGKQPRDRGLGLDAPLGKNATPLCSRCLVAGGMHGLRDYAHQAGGLCEAYGASGEDDVQTTIDGFADTPTDPSQHIEDLATTAYSIAQVLIFGSDTEGDMYVCGQAASCHPPRKGAISIETHAQEAEDWGVKQIDRRGPGISRGGDRFRFHGCDHHWAMRMSAPESSTIGHDSRGGRGVGDAELAVDPDSTHDGADAGAEVCVRMQMHHPTEHPRRDGLVGVKPIRIAAEASLLPLWRRRVGRYLVGAAAVQLTCDKTELTSRSGLVLAEAAGPPRLVC